MRSLPTGTVTFLFTDIEGSTTLLQCLGDRYAQILADQRQLLRVAFQSRGGHEVSTEGDASFVAFPRAKDAIEAAVAAQRAIISHPWPEGAEVRVRMGLHTGEPLSTVTAATLAWMFIKPLGSARPVMAVRFSYPIRLVASSLTISLRG